MKFTFGTTIDWIQVVFEGLITIFFYFLLSKLVLQAIRVKSYCQIVCFEKFVRLVVFSIVYFGAIHFKGVLEGVWIYYLSKDVLSLKSLNKISLRFTFSIKIDFQIEGNFMLSVVCFGKILTTFFERSKLN